MSARWQLFVCGSTETYYADERGWWKLDWLRRKFTWGRSVRAAGDPE